MAVLLLCTRVIYPDTDDYKNMIRLMKYIQVAISLTLILLIDKSGNIKCYIDAEFEVHKYMRSHTGSFMTMVTGGAYVQYIKQKLNTNSSTEEDIVRVDGVLSQVIWT